MDDYLTREELAKLLRVTTRTVHNYIKAGSVPAPVRVGRRYLWSRTGLVAFIQQQKAAAHTQADSRVPA